MAKQVATPKQTGNGGCTFEDEVSAIFLLKLLSGEPPLEVDAGSIQSIRFQKRVDDWHLDDLVLRLRNGNGNSANFAVSVKSTAYISESGFPKEFTVAAWEQVLPEGKGTFNIASDYLGIVTTPLDLKVSKAWNGLLQKAIVASPSEFAERIGTPQYGNAIERSLFNSLKCPDSLGVQTIETAALLQRVRHLQFDFENQPSDAENSAISGCQRLLQSGDRQQAISLWTHLKQIAREYATGGGDIDSKTKLASLLRDHFELSEFPDYVTDWKKLSEDTIFRLNKVRDRLGGELHLTCQYVESIELDNGIAALVGASGCGKSAIASQIARTVAPSGHAVWISASMLNQRQTNLLFADLSLAHPFSELLSLSTVHRGVIVVDGVEHLTEDGLANLSSLIEIAGVGSPGMPWGIVITCVFDQWENVLLRLKRRCKKQIDIHVHPIEFRHQKHRNEIVQSFPQLQHMLFRPQLGRLFDNLKILDLVVSNASNLTHFEEWVGETDILDWYWKEVVNRGSHGPGRARFLMKLSGLEADHFLSEVPSMDFESSECEFVAALIADDVIRKQDDRFGFTHDLLGDWARSRYLLSRKESIVELARQKAMFPRWQRAIRLYGLRLLESHDGGVEHWTQLISSLQPDDAMSVELDLILESVVFAANADQLLPKIWTTLISHEAVLLDRLLKRFLHTATFPSPRIVEQFSEASTTAATHHRLPFWPLWGPILRVLHEKRDAVVTLVPLQCARIASIWLRMTPDSWPLRREAAELMIATTEYVIQQSGMCHWEEELDTEAFAGLLAAASVFPDVVARRALELVERGEASPFARTSAAVVAPEELPSAENDESSLKPTLRMGRLFEVGPMRNPWPNGPRRRVKSSVRKGFLASHDPLQYLLRVKPTAANEVLLALLVNEPTPIIPKGSIYDYDYITDSLELNSDREFTPPMYFRGPFLTYLQTDATNGINVIVSLVNFATERWREKNPNAHPIECIIDGVSRQYFGGTDLFHWYRVIGNRLRIDVVESALMALEKWLYVSFDSQRDISQFIDQLLRESRSTAVLGVLVAVGRRHPELFKGPLRSLVPVWELQVWEEDYRLTGFRRHIGLELMSWLRWGETIWNMVRDWYYLDHRETTIGDVLVKLYLTDQEMRLELGNAREMWASTASEIKDPGERMCLEKIVRRFDERNWKPRLVENRLVFEFVEPEGVSKELTAARDALQMGVDISTLPFTCRKMLDENKGFPPEELHPIWEGLQRIKDAAGSDSEHADRWQNVVMGGIAVLWTHHREWVEIDADRKEWCETMFAQVLTFPPPRHGYYPPESLSNYYWDNFVALLAPGFLAEESTNVGCRRLVADIATAYKYSVVGDVVTSAFDCRRQLGGDFPRLLHLVLTYSGICNVQVTTRGGNCIWNTPDVEYDIEESIAKLISQYVDQSLPPEIPSLSEIAVSSNATIAGMVREQDTSRSDTPWTDQEFAGIQRRIDRGWGFEPGLIQIAFGWIDKIDLEDDAIERAKWIALVRNLLDAFIRPLGSPEQAVEDCEHDSFYTFPGDHIRWLFDRIAVVIPKLGPDENARSLWGPILGLGLDRVHWLDAFFAGWFIHGRKVEGGDAAFFREWKSMIDFAWNQPGWRQTEVQHNRGLDELFRSLMGLDFTGEYSLSDSKYRSFVTAMKPEYDRWADEFLDDSESAKCYSRFLMSPSAISHVRDGVRRLSDRVQSYYDWCWTEDRHLHTALLDLLEFDWRTNRAVIKRDTAVLKQFSTILKVMLDRQIPRAMELQDRIARAGS